tara:strand:+ start:380 stop:499 length:120 start_codon:yes stop_codon:yes gene_type:complete
MSNISPTGMNTTMTKKALEKARDEDRKRYLKRKEERKNK